MVVIILGIIVFFAGTVLKRSPQPSSRFGSILSVAGAVIVIAGIVSSAFKVIDPGMVGVQVLFGKVQDKPLESGLHAINPLVDITEFDTRTQNYTMSGTHNEGDVQGDDAIRVLSSDGLEVTIDLSVLYNVMPDRAPFIMQNIGIDFKDKIVRPVTRTALRDNAVAYQAVDLYSIKRQEFQNKINSTISKNFEANGLKVQQILIRNVSLPPSVKASIESKIYRNQTYVTDYGNLDFNERVNLISNDTYYIDRNFINNKLCIFVDDIKITGSHEHTVNKILNQYEVNGDFIFVYFAELANKDIHPKIENHYNYFDIKNVDDIISVIKSEHFQYNTRIVKFILSLSEDEFGFLINSISSKKSDELFHLAISNNYHQILEYKTNINVIKIE